MMDYAKVPVPYMIHGVQQYIEQGVPPGSFLLALFCNDLKESFRCADETNTAAMGDWVIFMVHEMPSNSQGSKARFEAWIEQGGLRGIQSAKEPEA